MTKIEADHKQTGISLNLTLRAKIYHPLGCEVQIG